MMKANELILLYNAGERYFDGANLEDADLHDADLRGAHLVGADLHGAHLKGADLYGAYLEDANLEGTCLDPDKHVPILTDGEILEAGLEIDTIDGREIVRGWRTLKSHVVGNHVYTPGWHEAPWFSLDTQTECHPGIYLASQGWLRNTYSGTDLVRCWCYRDELIHAGDKWRAQRIFVESES
jgi:hypothetical protein